ncbi:indoleamine 2,3-dioxygenase [Geosmithia morbida]|uniref:Indoleamine 2,3-dioxygenase n=1 Tax=Geosmithia morbida TaxID=1094350 RepID=A0A9P4Z212_9HYPO|nr:indoleamine 2,3-dioxygenase [Geosmithia morbida]KAF4125966.1 indoleamine 2,3-dioxygenase [Geosmithia morbida]
MLPPIPEPQDYDVSPLHGFLPETLPLTRLPDPYYNKWEAIVGNLQALILSRRLRVVIHNLPVLSTIGLEHETEWRRAYSLLCFMLHGYIWVDDVPAEKIPESISVPLLEISRHLEVPPVATYAAVCLWNFKPLFLDEDIDNLENLATLSTFTGSTDESWFYLVSVAIEGRGGPIIPLMLTAMDSARQRDTLMVTHCLCGFAERLADLTNLLQRMHERCDPIVFYHRIRPFLAGSKNMAEAGLPNGVLYEDGSGNEEFHQYSGGSNAQSSLIQFFDIALGIEHLPTGEKHQAKSGSAPNPSQRNNFIRDMRRYMPGPHARFLEDVSRVANIREFVEESRDTQLSVAYDACLAMLSAFRDKHIAIVTRYIITPSRQVRARSRSRSPEVARQKNNIATAGHKNQGQGQRGTGGTALIPFLKQARDETGNPAIEEWSRRFMKRQVVFQGDGDFFKGKPEYSGPVEMEDVEVKGLAGDWTMDDEVGGICHY